MTKVAHAVALFAAGILVAQPCAASDFQEAAAVQRQSSAFAGVNVRLPLGQALKAKPTARLQLTTSHTIRDMRTGATQTFKAQGLEIGGAKSGKPIFYLNGQSATDMQKKLNVGGSGTTLLIVGGVLLVVVLVAAATASAQSDLLNPCSGDSNLC